ncbi:two-component system response regulator TorR [Ferrimonas balearica]|uniref:two-component system response regulator TorR n=1 Tax=Ferrimonas balearica TaxID=44012 RepID=UPI001C956FF3|nr:two-component system response regulator TorR [Ferrimonas balearica]MBY5982289.1 two-component system response regulator TorR [Ferrimonas balearica]MBY6226224.1 two-component system response regulator TorR [Ferrimonas balearica]
MALTGSRILVVEDDSVTQMRHQGYFQQAGYQVTAVSNGAQMRTAMAEQEFDLVLLDVNLPDEDGLQLTRELRSESAVGIILVTGRSDSVDKIVGLEMGADDYVTKPVEMRELLVRVKNLLWRISLAQRPANEVPMGNELHFAGWTLNLGNRHLCREGVDVRLTTAEFELLAAFARYPQQVLARERLLNLVSHRVDAPDDRTIDVLVRRLRGKMEKGEGLPKLFVTVHGEGYLFGTTVTS